MSYSDTASAKRYASIAEVAAAQAKLSAEKLDNAPDYAAQAAASAAAAAISASTATSAEAVVNGLASSASASATAAAASAEEAGNAAAAAVGQCLRVPTGESVDVLPAITDREDTFLTFGSDGNTSLLPKSDVAILDNDGKIPTSMIPAIAISQIFVVNSQSAMLALDAQDGDVAKRTDLGYSFILANEPASTLSNWVQLNDDVLAQLSQSTGASLIGYGSETLEDVADRVALKLNSADLAASTGTNLVGTASGINLTSYLARTFIFMDDLPGIDTTGASDCSIALNNANALYKTTGSILLGNPLSTYKIENTVTVSMTFDFNNAIIIDNVQGFIPESGGRARQLFIIYNSNGAKVVNARITTASTRANLGSSSIPTVQIWVGGQYLGSAITTNVTLRNIIFNGGLVGMMAIAVMGETRGFLSENTEFYGDYSFGINFEYGLQPEDPAINPTWTNGRHPYNCVVRNMYGSGLLNCEGFIRTASSFNIKFERVIGYNVKSFFYGYCGDRNISRVSQNVLLENCINKIDGSVLTTANNCVWIVVVNKDGSTGTDLPSWTNYNQMYVLKNCEFWNNNTSGSACIRFMGTKGKVSLEQCILTGSYYGVNAQPSSNPTYNANRALVLRDCVLFNNYQDINIIGVTGSIVDSCTIKAQNSNSTLNPVSLGSGAHRTIIQNSLFDELPSSKAYIVGNANATDCVYDNNRFVTFSVGDNPIVNLARAFGKGNTTNSTAGFVAQTSTSYRIRGEDSTGIRTLDAGVTTYSADIADTLTSSAATTFNRIQGGQLRDVVIFRGVATGSSVTFQNAASGIAVGERIINLTGADKTVSGSGWVAKYMKLSSGWYEI